MQHKRRTFFLLVPLVLLGAASLGWTAASEIAAFQDITGYPRPATYTANGAVRITCVRAVQSAPLKTGDRQPACYVTAPGVAQQLPVKASIETNGPGTVTLLCKGSGQLGCTARISD